MIRVKKAHKDFTENELPSNRKEVFLDILKVRFDILIKVGILLFLFSLPLLIILFFRITYLNGLYYQLSNGTLTPSQYNNAVFSSSLLFDGLISLGVLLSSVGLSGTLKIYKELMWYEPIFLKEDFLEGIRENFCQTMICSLILSLIFLVSDIVYKSTWLSNTIRYLPSAILLIVCVPGFCFTISQISVYKNKVSQSIINSLVFVLKNVPYCLLLSLFIWAVSLLKLIPSVVVEFALLVVVIVLILPIVLLISMLFSYSQFDKYINKTNYPEIYKKGLWDSSTTNK